MSSEDNLPPVRHRRRALGLDTSTRVVEERDVFDPGPMVHYPPLPIGPDGLPVPAQLRIRIRDLRALDRKAAREFILRTLHAYLIAHRPMDEIARAFGVTINTIYAWRVELNKRMAAEFKAKTPIDLLVEQIAHYQRAKAYAWQQATRATEHVDKWRWVNTAMNADKHIADLYARTGIIDAQHVQPAMPVKQDNEDDGGRASTLANLAKQFLEGNYAKGKKKADPHTTEQDITNPIDDRDFLV